MAPQYVSKSIMSSIFFSKCTKVVESKAAAAVGWSEAPEPVAVAPPTTPPL